MQEQSSIAAMRDAACQRLLSRVRAIKAEEGINERTLPRVKDLLVELAGEGERLFPAADFAMPRAHGRNHMLDPAANDGFGLYYSISMPGKESAPHDHGIWCVSAGISGTEEQRFYRRTDDGTRRGFATVEQIAAGKVAPGSAIAMADHDIHATMVTGSEPARILSLYGLALSRFPTVLFFHPEFQSTRSCGVPQREVRS